MSRADPSRHAPQEVDEYLAAQAPESRATLKQLRAIINAAVPGCTERVSYKIPIFRLKMDVVALSAAKHHCSLHTMSKAIPVAMQNELKAAGIGISGTALHIRPGIAVPLSLVEEVLRRRLAEVNADGRASDRRRLRLSGAGSEECLSG